MKIKKKWRVLFLGGIFLVFFVYYGNNALVVSRYLVASEKIPESFDGYTIMQLSDLHGKSFGSEQEGLIQKVEDEKPDIIVFTGDLVDANRYNEKPSLTLMKKLVEMAPVYYVSGNHEWWSGHYEKLEKDLLRIGVHVLRNESVDLVKGEGAITLLGIDDPANTQTTTKKNLTRAMEGRGERFFLLLAHRPEEFARYVKEGVDLVFSGHAHGGQVLLPFIGGVIAPDQGFLPAYTVGIYEREETMMIVNRGLGNSIIPIRLFNRPEIVMVTLSAKES